MSSIGSDNLGQVMGVVVDVGGLTRYKHSLAAIKTLAFTSRVEPQLDKP